MLKQYIFWIVCLGLSIWSNLSILQAQQASGSWLTKLRDFNGIYGESIFRLIAIPQGYAGNGAYSNQQGKQITVITTLDQAGNKLKVFELPHIHASDIYYSARDTAIYVHGLAVVNGQSKPNLTKIDVEGNVLWSKTHDYPGCRGFWRIAQLANGHFFLQDDQTQPEKKPIIHLDNNGEMVEVLEIGGTFNVFNGHDLRTYTDSTFLVVSDGFNGRPDSFPPIGECGYYPDPMYSDGTFFAEIDKDGKVVRQDEWYNYADNDFPQGYIALLPGKQIAKIGVTYKHPDTCAAFYHVQWFDSTFQLIRKTELGFGLQAIGCRENVAGDIIAFASRTPGYYTYTFPNGITDDNGDDVVWKLDGETGQILWHKAVIGPGIGPPSWFYSMNDVQPTDDGGALLGISHLALDVSQTEKWFLKLDSNGCLIPGCDSIWLAPLPSSTLQEPFEPLQISIWPNPATTEIAYTLNETLRAGYLVISESTGKLQRYALIDGATGRLDVSNFASGMYFLSIYDKDKRLRAVERFVIAN